MKAGGDPEKTMEALDDGKMRPMQWKTQAEEIEWLRKMLGNAQQEIAALQESAAEARADRADNLLKALLTAKSEVAGLKGEVAGLQERLAQEREQHAAEIKALRDGLS